MSKSPASPSWTGALAVTRGRQVNYNDALRPAPAVDTPLPQRDIGMQELMTLFPNHSQWPAILMRFYHNSLKIRIQYTWSSLQQRRKLSAAGSPE